MKEEKIKKLILKKDFIQNGLVMIDTKNFDTLSNNSPIETGMLTCMVIISKVFNFVWLR